MAFHITEYLTSPVRPYPYIPDPTLTAKDLMYRYIDLIREYDFKEILLIGGAGLRNIEYLLNLDERIRVAGFSWFLDAQKMILYTPLKSVDVSYKFFECTCPVCSVLRPKDRRSINNIAKHNLYMLRYLTNTVDKKVDIKYYSLILDYSEDILIFGGLYVGNPLSAWEDAISIIYDIKPSYVIFMGNVIDYSECDENQFNQWTLFIRHLIKLYEEYDVKSLFMLGPVEKYSFYRLIRHRCFLYGLRVDPLLDNLNYSRLRETATHLPLIRLYNTAKRNMIVKKEITNNRSLLFYLETRAVEDITSLEKLIEDLYYERTKREVDWIITTQTSYPYIDSEHKVAFPGIWLKQRIFATPNKGGAIYIPPDAKPRLIERELG